MADQQRPYILAETNWKSVRDTSFDVAVLPWGATEAHNFHLPYATDNFQADFVAASAAKIAWEKGAKPIVLPCIPFGVNTGQLDIDLCININPSTQLSILQDVAQVLEACGIQKLVILNGHGGNHFKQMIRELDADYPDLFFCTLNWYESADAKDFFEEPGDHAGDLETSCMLHIQPDLCLPLSDAGTGSAKQFRIAGLKEGWVSAQRQWSEVTEDTGVGDPSSATEAKGKVYLNACAERIGEFLAELGAADITNMYE